jgi:enediyne biosynthesis protein E4
MPSMRRTASWLGGGVLALLLALGGLWLWIHSPGPAAPPVDGRPAWFRDVSEEVGLNFVHDAGPTGTYPMPQSIGSGAALFDFDRDGLMDIYLLQNGGPNGATNRLYRQLPGGRFQDVSKGSGLDIAGYNMGVAVGDVNNDGWPDVLVTQFGGVKLFLNNGDGTFTDVTREAGLDNPLWGTSAAFVDYDRDGWLDLVIVNYVLYVPSHECPTASGKPEFCAPHPFPGSAAKLYRNLGRTDPANPKTVRFADVTLPSGIGKLAGPGLGVVCADFDGDGWPDVFVANDGQPNYLWINRPNKEPGTRSATPRVFVEEAASRGLAYNGMGQAQSNMGTALADVDGDGLLDLFIPHVTSEQNTLWKQGPRGLFHDATASAGLFGSAWRATGFGAALADFDQDGFPDLAVVNGDIQASYTAPEASTVHELGPFWSWYAQRNQLFANDGAGRFQDVSRPGEPFCASPNVARGLAWGDVDGDGAIDLLVTTIGGPAHLYRNVVPGRGHWLMVRAVDPNLNRDAYGAQITVRAGGRSRVALINPGQSFLCSNDSRAHFGLGTTERVDSLRVLWPDGAEEGFRGGPVDRVVVLEKGKGEAVEK